MKVCEIRNIIKEKAIEVGLKFDEQCLYVENPKDNLITEFANWEEIKTEFGKGSGSELKVQKGKQKFCAIHSSACLCVNNFAKIKDLGDEIDFLGLGKFKDSRFEKIVNTGISKPNLDFFLENKETVCGVESKFTEIYSLKLPNRKDSQGNPNLSKYVKRFLEIKNVPKGFKEKILDFYICKKEKMHLDVAQLIKHTLGLINYSKECGKTPVLVYIFWEPKEQIGVNVQHRKELKEFEDKISNFIEFKYFSYKDLWDYYEKNESLKDIVEKNKKRYFL